MKRNDALCQGNISTVKSLIFPYTCGYSYRLDFSLFNVASSGDVPFHQPQQFQYLHHDSIYQTSPLFSFVLHSFLCHIGHDLQNVCQMNG